MNQRIPSNGKLKYALSFLFLILVIPNLLNAATFSFNKLYKGTGTSYGLNTQSITGITPITGTSIQFYQAGAQFSGNSLNGVLTYYDNNNQLQTIYGNLNRQDKSGNNSRAFYFIVSNSSYTTFTGEAYLFIVPGYESVYTTGASVSTSSDPMDNALNAVVASINSITLSSASGTDSQTTCISTAITSITYTTTNATGATFSGLPTGVSGTWSSNKVTISGTPSVTGTFNYTVTLTGGSGSGTAKGTIVVKARNTITLSSASGTDAQTPNVNAAITNITYTTTGATGATFSGLPAGVTGTWSSNTITISGTPTAVGTYNYTITLTGGCSVVTKTGSITVNQVGANTIVLSSAAGTDGQTICKSTAITNITYATTIATGATFTGLPSGVTGAWASNVATISGTPTIAGTYNYTVTLTGGVGSVSKSGTIIVSGNNTISLSSAAGTDAQTPIVNSPITDITYNTTGATGATVTGLPSGLTGSWSSNVFTITGTPTGTITTTTVYNYTISLTGGCGVVTKTGHIDVNPAGSNTVTITSISGSDAQTICSNSSIANITYATTGATGATFTGLPAGINGVWSSNVITISGTPSGTFTSSTTYNYKITLTGGIGTVEAAGSITINPASVAGTISGGGVSVCTGTNSTTLTLNGNEGTIQWQSSSDNNSFYDIAGENGTALSLTNLTATTYYKANITNGSCTTVSTGTVTVTVSPASVAGTISGGDVSICSGTANSTTLTLAGYTGTIQWQSSTDNVTFTNITNATSATYTATNVSTTTYYRAVVTSGACSSATTSSVAITITQCIVANPDINATNVNTAVTGNVSTNDKITTGTTYGTPVPSSSNPTGATITLNSDGTYTFTATLPGRYVYYVTVCAAGQTTGCAMAPLEISVTDPLSTTNPPIAKNDYTTSQMNTPVSVKVLSNDKSGNINTNLVAGTVSITTAPANGSASVNTTTGVITYTPNTGFVGTDSLNYQVCDNATPSNCQVATSYFKISSTAVAEYTTADDDFNKIEMKTVATGNVLTNDLNSAGNTLTVTSNSTPLASQGTISINADGTYTFTPTATFSGPVDITYTACTNASVCATATLHILVSPPGIVANPDINATNVNTPVTGNINTNDKIPAGTTYGTPAPSSKNPSGATLTLKSDGTYTFTTPLPGRYVYYIPVCAAGQTTGCPITTLEISVTDPNSTTNPPLAKNDYTTSQVNTPVTVKVLANDKVANPNTTLLPSTISVVATPVNGTASVNTTTGVITFTPNTGFVGTDSLNYNVCDNASPSNCQVATVYFKISSTAVAEYTTADDDFNKVDMNKVATGNVLTNDLNSAGNTLTVTSNSTPLASQGTFSINTDGSYTFTPTANFYGPLDITYTACTSASVCATATLHILVSPVKPAPPKPIGGTYTSNDPLNPKTIVGSVTNIPSGCKVIYCDANGLNCGNTAPNLPTKPGIYVWCVKSLDTITNLTSSPCVYDTITILPYVKVANATYVNGVTTNPKNIAGLVTDITPGSTPRWCDVNGNNCTSTAPVLPLTAGKYVWCVKALDTASGLLSAGCKMDTVTILNPYTVMELTKTARSVKLNPDGTILVTFAMNAINKTDASIDNVSIKDDLSLTFNTTKGVTVSSLTTYGGLVKNSGYDGITNIELLDPTSKVAANKSDSLVLKVLLESPTVYGNLFNTATLTGNTKYGKVSVISNDPLLNPSDSTKRTPTAFVIPKLNIVIAGGFSPNNDGMNDKWIIIRPFGTTIRVKVFNRWGNLVYENNNYKNDWDGRGQGNFMGQFLPEGAYFYLVEAVDPTGNIQKFSKSFTILR